MANVKNQLAQLGMGTLVAGLKAVESSVSKKQYKRLIATAVAQLLIMHPDYGAGKARRRARKVVGAKPSRKLLVKPAKVGVKKTLGMAGKVGRKITERVNEVVAAGPASGDSNGARGGHENGDSSRQA